MTVDFYLLNGKAHRAWRKALKLEKSFIDYNAMRSALCTLPENVGSAFTNSL
jgi:hypothetical protein